MDPRERHSGPAAGRSAPGGTSAKAREEDGAEVCPVCGSPLLPEKCKVVCRSEACRYRIVYSCSEF